jgi:hypothetical protein
MKDQLISKKAKFQIVLRKEYEIAKEAQKIGIWKKYIKSEGMVSYWSFSLVSNIHQRINLKAGFYCKEFLPTYSIDQIMKHDEPHLRGWFFHQIFLSTCFQAKEL